MSGLQLGFGGSWFWGAGALVLVVCGLGAALFFRLVPVTETDVPGISPLPAAGETALPGGYYAVRSLDALELTDLESQISKTSRTRQLSGSINELPVVFVHRSKVWGFPDITQVWVESGHIHIYSHLVYGRSDLGVNRKRIEGWLSALGIR